MKVLNTCYVALMLVAFASTSVAQVTISHTDLAGPGFVFNSHQLLWGAEFDVGTAGANGEWSFGNYEWDDHVLTRVIAPDETPYAQSFPTATRAIGAIDQGSYVYEEIDASTCLMLGTANPEFVQLYEDPVLVLSLPVMYQSTWHSVMSISQELEPGMVMMMTDSGDVLVDGWGVVSTPYGEFDVLRIFTHHYTRTYMNGELIAESQFLSYAWVNQDGIAVVNVDSDIDVVDPNFNFGTIEMNEFADPVDPGRIAAPTSFYFGQNYPNPFNAQTVLPLDVIRAGEVTLDVYDALGRLVESRSRTLPIGQHSIVLDGSGWASGNYFARVSSVDHVVTRRMILVK